LALDVIRRVQPAKPVADSATQYFEDKLREHRAYVEKHGEDMPEVRDWKWEG
jgi:xylulose-5-phosphate/fructose-6-phosphate phosphoketolase